MHLAEHSTRSVVLLNVSLHRADESQVARNSCPRLPRLILGLVSIRLSCRCRVKFNSLRSISLALSYSCFFKLIRSFTDPA